MKEVYLIYIYDPYCPQKEGYYDSVAFLHEENAKKYCEWMNNIDTYKHSPHCIKVADFIEQKS